MAGKVINHAGVSVVGYTNIESRMASTASSLFGGNVTNLLLSMKTPEVKQPGATMYSYEVEVDFIHSLHHSLTNNSLR